MLEKNDTEQLGNLYQEYYHNDGIHWQVMESFRWIAKVLVDSFHPIRSIDMGCSGGGLVRALEELGVNAIGVDGSPAAVGRTPGKILLHDLRCAQSIPWNAGIYDLVTCCDVLEHIEQEYDDVACSHIVGAMAPGATGVVGAATPGQGGLGHCNCQEPEYWIGKLTALGLLHDPDATERLKAGIMSNPAHATAWWWHKNAVVYRKVAI